MVHPIELDSFGHGHDCVRSGAALSSCAMTFGAGFRHLPLPRPNPAVNRTRRYVASPSVGVGGGAPVTLFR